MFARSYLVTRLAIDQNLHDTKDREQPAGCQKQNLTGNLGRDRDRKQQPGVLEAHVG